MPSRTAALATATASISSDFPGRRSARRVWPIILGATLTTRSPCPTSERSSRPETCRQSSSAHTRSPTARSSCAHRHAANIPSGSDRTVLVATILPVRRLHSRERVRALVGVRSDHDHVARPFIDEPSKADLRRTHLSRGDATLLSSHAGDPRTAVSDTTDAGQTQRSAAILRVSSPPAEEPAPPAGQHHSAAPDSDTEPILDPPRPRWSKAGVVGCAELASALTDR